MSIEWRGAAVSPGDGVPTPDNWEPVSVPGRPTQFAGADAVAYRAEFEDPRDPDEEHALLVLHGTYAHARVWFNGEELASHDAYFEPVRLPLDVQPQNELVVECRSPSDRFGGIYDTDRVPEERAVPGIWWDASIETHPDPYVEALSVEPHVAGEEPSVDVTARLYSNEPLDDRITLSIRPAGETRGGGTMDRLRVEESSGRSVVSETVTMRDAALWWPHDVGAQPRYAIRAKLEDARRTVETGLRTVEYDAEDGLQINGQRVPARGINVLDATPDDVALAAEANANLLRSHAHAVSPAVMDACDEHGVLLWQDLPLTGPGEFDEYRGTELAESLVSSSRSHPSLAMVGIHDDPIESYAAGLGGGVLDRLRFRWRAWRASYDDSTANAVAEAIDEVPTVPVIGRPGIDPDGATLYPGWEFGDAGAIDWVCNRYGLGDVVAEFGAGADRDGAASAGESQATTVRRVAEGLRRREADVIAAYALRDSSPDGMGLVDDHGEPTVAYEHLSAAYEPVQAVLADPTPGKSAVVVVHDAAEVATVTVEWDVAGEREQTDLEIDAFGRETVDTVALADGDAVTLAVARDGVVSRNEYSI